MLTRLGCTVDTAENGKLALEKILHGSPPSGTPTPGVSEHSGPPMFDQNVQQPSGGPSYSPANGPPSVQQMHWMNFDIVFLDNQMPVMSGLDTVRTIRSKGRSDLVVGVTGNALLSDQQEYLDVGVDRVLTKPVFEASLKGMLHVAAHRRKTYEKHQNQAQSSSS